MKWYKNLNEVEAFSLKKEAIIFCIAAILFIAGYWILIYQTNFWVGVAIFLINWSQNIENMMTYRKKFKAIANRLTPDIYR